MHLLNNNLNNKANDKLTFFYDTINNFYFSKSIEAQNEFINYFYKIQKTYHTLNRLCLVYKIKKAKQMKQSNYKVIFIFIGIVITMTVVLQVYWNLKKYDENKKQFLFRFSKKEL